MLYFVCEGEKMSRKRVLSSFVTLIAGFFVVIVSSCARDVEPLFPAEEQFASGYDFASNCFSKGFVFELSENKDYYFIIGYDGVDSVIAIPSTHLGLPVVGIESLAPRTDFHYFSRIYVPESVKSITCELDRYTYEICTNSLIIPAGWLPFNTTTFKIRTTVYTGVNSIKVENQRYGTATIKFDVVNNEFAMLTGYSADNQKSSDDPDVVANIPEYLGGFPVREIGGFMGGKSISKIEQITFSTGLLKIHANAFRLGENAIRKIVMPDTLQYIGDFACYSLRKLSEIDFSSLTNLVSIGESAFLGSNLASAILPESLESLGSAAFSSSNLLSIKFPLNLRVIANGVLCDTPITNVEIAGPVEVIETLAFCGTNNLRKLTIPNTVRRIESYAFLRAGIKSVFIPRNVIEVQSEVFYRCLGVDIYTDATSLPIGWSNDLESYNVHYNFSADQFNSGVLL